MVIAMMSHMCASAVARMALGTSGETTSAPVVGSPASRKTAAPSSMVHQMIDAATVARLVVEMPRGPRPSGVPVQRHVRGRAEALS
jgi:hypothetical protein